MKTKLHMLRGDSKASIERGVAKPYVQDRHVNSLQSRYMTAIYPHENGDKLMNNIVLETFEIVNHYFGVNTN